MRRSLILVIAMMFFVVACSDDAPSADPESTIEKYIETYNADDIDGIMELFSDESVITDHPFSGSSTGLTAIRALHVQDRAAAASENAYTISNIEVTGTTVTWDHTWTNNAGDTYCPPGPNTAVVEDGIILSWTWTDTGGAGC